MGAALPFPTPTLAEALSRLRQDVFDQVGGIPRWADTDLQRAVDRALDRYSAYNAFTQTALLPAVGGSRLYALPATPLLNPAWWAESVEYPAGHYPRRLVPYRETGQPCLGLPPAPAPAAVAAGGGQGQGQGQLSGQYRYCLTFAGIAGETLPGPSSPPVNVSGGSVLIPLPPGPDPYTRGRVLYRTAAGGADGTQRLLAQIPGNSTASYLDTAPDSALGAPPPAADSTADRPLIELLLPAAALPDPAAPGALEITLGGKHLWSEDGTTVPEQHHDIVLLGAASYAVTAYAVPTSDLFVYQDGAMRDRVDESKVQANWLALRDRLGAEFTARLEEVKRERDASGAALAQWGAVPARWHWT